MVETRVGEDFETGANGAALGVVGSIDNAGDAGVDDCASAHAAWLDGDVERGTGKAVVAEKAGGFAKDNDFGVGCGVDIANGAVVRTGQNLAVMDQHGADGYFAGCDCG